MQSLCPGDSIGVIVDRYTSGCVHPDLLAGHCHSSGHIHTLWEYWRRKYALAGGASAFPILPSLAPFELSRDAIATPRCDGVGTEQFFRSDGLNLRHFKIVGGAMLVYSRTRDEYACPCVVMVNAKEGVICLYVSDAPLSVMLAENMKDAACLKSVGNSMLRQLRSYLSDGMQWRKQMAIAESHLDVDEESLKFMEHCSYVRTGIVPFLNLRTVKNHFEYGLVVDAIEEQLLDGLDVMESKGEIYDLFLSTISDGALPRSDQPDYNMATIVTEPKTKSRLGVGAGRCHVNRSTVEGMACLAILAPVLVQLLSTVKESLEVCGCRESTMDLWMHEENAIWHATAMDSCLHVLQDHRRISRIPCLEGLMYGMVEDYETSCVLKRNGGMTARSAVQAAISLHGFPDSFIRHVDVCSCESVMDAVSRVADLVGDGKERGLLVIDRGEDGWFEHSIFRIGKKSVRDMSLEAMRRLLLYANVDVLLVDEAGMHQLKFSPVNKRLCCLSHGSLGCHSALDHDKTKEGGSETAHRLGF